MKLLTFLQDFGTEEQCRQHFRLEREKQGLCCAKCANTKFYWLKKKEQWQCSSCSYRMTLKSGSMFEHSKIPISTWYLAMMFMCFSKKGISACELQRQLELKRYETVWKLMHKIRTSMGNRDKKYKLSGEIEFDEAYFSISTPQNTVLKRGKGSQKKQNVAVAAESTELENFETSETSRQCRYFKMQVLENQKVESVNGFVEDCITKTSLVFSDKGKNYVDIAKHVETHVLVKSDKESTKTTLKWVHIAISNAKRTLLGVYHKIHGKYLQRYLDEFCYKLNRRYFGDKLFDRLVIAHTKTKW